MLSTSNYTPCKGEQFRVPVARYQFIFERVDGLGDGNGGLVGRDLPRPKAILAISAHWWTPGLQLTGDLKPKTIHDFGGFPQALYELRYPAPGGPELAGQIAGLLRASGIEARVHPERGLDHGAWVPLMLLYPRADIPVVQLSIDMSKTAHYHFELGRALSALRKEQVLLVGSGSATHNLREFFSGGYSHDAAPPGWVTEFADWLTDQVEAARTGEVLGAVEMGPNGKRNHPTMDHIHPLCFAYGAAGDTGHGLRLHHSITYGVLAMDAYGFGDSDELGPLCE